MIPNRDNDASAWMTNFGTEADASPATYGLTAPQGAAALAAALAFAAALMLATDPGTRTTATIAAKDAARATAESVIRPLAFQVSLNAAVTPASKATLGVTIRDEIPTPIPAPVVAPGLSIQKAIIGLVTVLGKNPESDSRRKPEGSTGIEVWAAVGTTFATDPAQASLRMISGRSPFRVAFAPEESGKAVTMYARYKTRSGPGGMSQSGPWSAPLQFHAL